MNNKAIGVFDSGIGGLTVYQALKERLPGEKVVYLGDTARLPYGTKSSQTIIQFSEENAKFLLKKEVKIIVVACNSASSYAIPYLQHKFNQIPVLGVIEPGAEAAVRSSKNKIGVIGTTATILSRAYEKSILKKKPGTSIISKDCPLFVPLVEEGWINHKVTHLVIKEYLLPLKEEGIDCLVLGCTHYPVLINPISNVVGTGIKLINSANTSAEEVFFTLNRLGWLRNSTEEIEDEFFVTDFPDRFKKVGEIFLNRKIETVHLI